MTPSNREIAEKLAYDFWEKFNHASEKQFKNVAPSKPLYEVIEEALDAKDAASKSREEGVLQQGIEKGIANVGKWFDRPKELDSSNCPACGAFTVPIRAKYPNGTPRKICPQCAFERLEDIYDGCTNRTASTALSAREGEGAKE